MKKVAVLLRIYVRASGCGIALGLSELGWTGGAALPSGAGTAMLGSDLKMNFTPLFPFSVLVRDKST
jgi:hypothetical protein